MNSASLCSLAGRYDNPIPTRFLAPIDCLKILAQHFIFPLYLFSALGYDAADPTKYSNKNEGTQFLG